MGNNSEAWVVKAAPSGPDRTTTSDSFVDLPDMNGVLNTGANSSLQIVFSAEVNTANGRMFVRARVDGQVASPSDVVFAIGEFTGTRSFILTKDGLGAGPHLVQMQWSTDPGGTVYVGDRTLTLAAFPVGMPQGGLVVKAAPSGPDKTTNSVNFIDIPDLNAAIATAANSNLKITLSGEVNTVNGRMFVRALVDGQVANPSDVVFAIGGFAGTRAFTFTKDNLAAGQHVVQIQWSTDAGGTAHIGDRTLTLCGLPEITQDGGLSVKAAPSGPDKTTNSVYFVDVPDMQVGVTTAANSNLEITFSGEADAANGRMFVRALVDGQVASPSDVVFAIGGFTGTRSFTFVKENVSAGPHTVDIQWSTDRGGTANLGDRTLTVVGWRRQIPDLSDGFYGVAPAFGARKVLTILWDPHRPNHPAPGSAQITNLLFGAGPSVKGYFLENSGGRLTLENAGVLGWYDSDKPADHYWNHPANPCAEGFINGHIEKWAEAIRKANNTFNFAQFDTNHDGVLSPDELTILIVIPQNGAFGTQNPVSGRQHPHWQPLVVDGVRIDTMVEAYIGNPPSLGLVAHELAHILLGAGDMYFDIVYPCAAGPYSLMDQSPANPPHLDPFHKLRLGWLQPTIVMSDGVQNLTDVETTRRALILYNPTRTEKEYFIVENRWPGNSYDQLLPHAGLAVWHIIEDPGTFEHLPAPPGVDPQGWSKVAGWARFAIRMIRPVYGPPIDWRLWDGANAVVGYDLLSVDPNPQHVTLRWADGTPSGFALRNISPAGPVMSVQVDVPF